jgi:hypothetical protein
MGPSTGGPFFPHDYQIATMKHIFKYYAGILGCKIISPKTEGGSVYTEIRDHILDGYRVQNYDVSGMELISPSIVNGRVGRLHYGIGTFSLYLGPIPELLSGVLPTSDIDMIAHLELLTRLLYGDVVLIVILGDDATIVFRTGGVKKTKLYDEQISDERIHRTLGLTCTKYMHPVGCNITIDNADSIMACVPGSWNNNQLTLEERQAIAELFTGFINGVPVPEVLRKSESQRGWYSPKELLAKLARVKQL